MKKNSIMSFVVRLMELKIITLSEISKEHSIYEHFESRKCSTIWEVPLLSGQWEEDKIK